MSIGNRAFTDWVVLCEDGQFMAGWHDEYSPLIETRNAWLRQEGLVEGRRVFGEMKSRGRMRRGEILDGRFRSWGSDWAARWTFAAAGAPSRVRAEACR